MKKSRECPKCGAVLTSTDGFCSECGTKVKGGKVGAFFKRLLSRIPISTTIAIVVIFGLVITLLIVTAPPRRNSSYFRTPERAIEYFAGRLFRGDYENAMSAFNTLDKIDSFNYAAMLTEKGIVVPLEQPGPNGSLYDLANEAQFRYAALNETRMLIYNLLLPGQLYGRYSATFDTLGMTPEQLIAMLDMSNLSKAKLVRCDEATRLTKGESYAEYARSNNVAFGFIDRTEYYALFELGGQYWYTIITLTKTNSGWQIDTLRSAVSGLPSSAILSSSSVEHYTGLIK